MLRLSNLLFRFLPQLILVGMLCACGGAKVAVEQAAKSTPSKQEEQRTEKEVRAERLGKAIFLDAATLCKEYVNEVNGDDKYKNAELVVFGEVHHVGKMLVEPLDSFVFLSGPAVNQRLKVRCDFEAKRNSQIAKLKSKECVYVLGKCLGKVGDEATVILKDCRLLAPEEVQAGMEQSRPVKTKR
jgi:hypothetical protein